MTTQYLGVLVVTPVTTNTPFCMNLIPLVEVTNRGILLFLPFVIYRIHVYHNYIENCDIIKHKILLMS